MARRDRVGLLAACLAATCLATAGANAQTRLPPVAGFEAEERVSTDLEDVDLGSPAALPIYLPLADVDGEVRMYIAYDGGGSALLTDLDGVPLVKFGQSQTRKIARTTTGVSDIKRLQAQIDQLRAELATLKSSRR